MKKSQRFTASANGQSLATALATSDSLSVCVIEAAHISPESLTAANELRTKCIALCERATNGTGLDRFVMCHVSIGTKERTDLGLKQPNKFRIHKLEFVGNVQTDDALCLEVRPKLLRELVPMCLLHHEDDITPFKQLRTNRSFSFRIETS